jgi:hypothetical protein
MSSSVEGAVGERIAAAPLEPRPFAHLYVREVFPRDFYDELQRHLPPPELLLPLEKARGVKGYPQRFVLELSNDQLAGIPEPYRGFWGSLASWMVNGAFSALVLDKFREVIEARFGGKPPGKLASEALLVNDRTHYSLGPHTDSKTKVVSMLFYLPGHERLAKHGTSLYASKKPGFKCAGGPHYAFDGFDRIATMPFLPNTMFAFAKTAKSFHGVEPIENVDISRFLLLYDIYLDWPKVKFLI